MGSLLAWVNIEIADSSTFVFFSFNSRTLIEEGRPTHQRPLDSAARQPLPLYADVCTLQWIGVIGTLGSTRSWTSGWWTQQLDLQTERLTAEGLQASRNDAYKPYPAGILAMCLRPSMGVLLCKRGDGVAPVIVIPRVGGQLYGLYFFPFFPFFRAAVRAQIS